MGEQQHTEKEGENMPTVHDLIATANFEEIFAQYRKHYEELHRSAIWEIFQVLKEIRPSAAASNMVLFIRAIRENDCGDDVVTDTFDCDDRSIFFDVCGKENGDPELYSIASSTYEDILGCFVHDDTLARFTPAQILAHILWSLDW